MMGHSHSPSTRIIEKKFISFAERIMRDGSIGCAPYVRYLSLVVTAPPIHTVVIGESPYPKDYFSKYGAAFAFDRHKTEHLVNEVPVSVDILAHDMSFRTGCTRTYAVSVFERSWALLGSGILFINSHVSVGMGEVKKYKEAIDQCDLICHILKAAHVSGVYSMNVFALGVYASDFCSTIISSLDHIAGLSIKSYVSNHPANASRKNSMRSLGANVHTLLDNEKFSIGLYAVLTNCVGGTHYNTTSSNMSTALSVRYSRAEVDAMSSALRDTLSGVLFQTERTVKVLSDAVGSVQAIETHKGAVRAALTDTGVDEVVVNAFIIVYESLFIPFTKAMNTAIASMEMVNVGLRSISTMNKGEVIAQHANLSAGMFDLREMDDQQDPSSFSISGARAVSPLGTPEEIKDNKESVVKRSEELRKKKKNPEPVVVNIEKDGNPNSITTESFKVGHSIVLSIDATTSVYADITNRKDIANMFFSASETGHVTVEMLSNVCFRRSLRVLSNYFGTNAWYIDDIDKSIIEALSITTNPMMITGASKEFRRTKKTYEAYWAI